MAIRKKITKDEAKNKVSIPNISIGYYIFARNMLQIYQ